MARNRKFRKISNSYTTEKLRNRKEKIATKVVDCPKKVIKENKYMISAYQILETNKQQ